jgi:hypothetical protein
MHEDDMPKSIIVVLVVLAVAISILGTFTVLNEMKELREAPVYSGIQAGTGKISFTLEDPTHHVNNGKISVNIEDREE